MDIKNLKGGGDDDLMVDMDDIDVEIDLDDKAGTVAREPVRSETLPDTAEFDRDEENLDRNLRRRDEAEDEVSEDDEDDPQLDSMRRVTAAEDRLRQTEAQTAVRLAESDARVAQTQMDAARVAIDRVKEKLTEARRGLKHARDSGDTEAEIQLESDIEQLNTLNRELEDTRQRIPKPEDIINYGRTKAQQIMQQGGQGTNVAPGLRATHPLAEKWSTRNAWMRDPANKDATQYIASASAQLVRNGWDPNSAGFYNELSRRIGAKFPQIKVGSIQAPKQANGKPQVRTPVAPSRSSGGAPQSQAPARNAKSYTLTRDDVGAMVRMKLDPKNITHRKYFAKSRIESANRAKG